ncbi:hypothetical protein [Tenacibaculum sp. C7A-26P2]|uniref:hypothetical protein n=1 Tax=Tenacibaculum sp. C7A-26P2 TaxID=3447504 RepID=UPI003F82655E
MHKKLASDLTSLAHSILKMKNKEDVLELKKKAFEVYEKLSILAYVNEYINTTPNADFTKEELLKKIVETERKLSKPNISKETFNSTKIENKTTHKEIIPKEGPFNSKNNKVEEPSPITEKTSSNTTQNKLASETKDNDPNPEVKKITEQSFDEFNNILFNKKNDSDERKTPTLEEELNDTLPVDVMANLFEKVESKKSLNDQLQKTLQIGLNDRIAFVKNLFEGNQSDFNRVISQLNTCKTEKEAKNFINNLVKPDYDWSEKEEYETRLIEIIERRFT